jgi:hypothetical protein
MSETVSDKIKTYSEHRLAVNRRAVVVLIVAPLLLALARSPDFELKDPLNLVEGKLHNGYVAAYGHFIILIVTGMYWGALASCAQLHSAVRWDLRDAKRDGFQDTESYLMRPPFCLRPSKERPYLAWLSALSPLLIGAVFYAVFYWDYLYFHAANRKEHGLNDLFLGVPDQGGFHGHWNRHMPSHPWINAPEQTWLGLLGLLLMIFFAVSGFFAIRWYQASMKELADAQQRGS